jgi:glycosyltransferase involved in cell wall biosynthesis
MNQKPVVSVIIIFLNGEKYLDEAIASVFAQTFDGWELLLCDDGSTDGATAIAKQWAQRHPDRVRYLEHEGHLNHGMSATRNLGLRHAQGEFIAWLDADDVWLPQKLTRQLELIRENPTAAMVYGPLRIWYSWNGKSTSRHRDFTQDVGFPANSLIPAPKLLCAFLRNDMHIPSGILIRKSVLDEVGGYEQSFRDEFEDVIVHSKVGLKYPAFVAGDWWYKYRQHEDSCCAETRRVGRERQRRLVFLEKLQDYMRSNGYQGTEAWHVLQEQLAPYRNRLKFQAQEMARNAMRRAKQAALAVLPPTLVMRYRAWRHGSSATPPVGCVDFGGLRRTNPISPMLGRDRGLPTDTYYLDQFFASHADDIRGHVLEVGESIYARAFGRDRITRCDILDPTGNDPEATIHADLGTASALAKDTYDCILVPQAMRAVWDVRTALANLKLALKPGGVLLATLPGITPLSRYHMERGGDFWRFTSASAKRLFEEQFDSDNLRISSYGNVLTATSGLYGVAADELQSQELDVHDPDVELLVAVRAQKPAGNNGNGVAH